VSGFSRVVLAGGGALEGIVVVDVEGSLTGGERIVSAAFERVAVSRAASASRCNCRSRCPGVTPAGKFSVFAVSRRSHSDRGNPVSAAQRDGCGCCCPATIAALFRCVDAGICVCCCWMGGGIVGVGVA
jgi:hypothetical protein